MQARRRPRWTPLPPVGQAGLGSRWLPRCARDRVARNPIAAPPADVSELCDHPRQSAARVV